MKSVLIVWCLTFCLVASLPAPHPQDDDTPQPPAPGSKPPDFIAALANEEENNQSVPDTVLDTVSGDETVAALPIPPQVLEPIVEPPASAAELPGRSEGEGDVVEAESPRTIPTVDEDCGPACMLANQTPIIFLVLILVIILLLLMILFGCYFMKKLHGKAIFTTGQRHRNMVAPLYDVEHFKTSGSGGVLQETKTFETFIPGESETKKVVTTTTTKIVQSGSSRDQTLESPLRTPA